MSCEQFNKTFFSSLFLVSFDGIYKPEEANIQYLRRKLLDINLEYTKYNRDLSLTWLDWILFWQHIDVMGVIISG